MNLIEFTPKGLYCPLGDFYIDPWQRVKCAVITHAHSDHARWGMGHYIAHTLTAPIIKYRLGEDSSITSYNYNKTFNLNGVSLSFHPAGHIIGSAQVRIEYKGEVWVVSGDYKLMDDGISTPFEPVKCHTFISESTFGLPIYKWRPQQIVFDDINNWWSSNAAENKATVLLGYSLGKAQRILQNVDSSIGPIYVHGAIDNINKIFRENGIPLRKAERVTPDMPKSTFHNALILAPTSAQASPWLRRFEPYSIGIASGWMALRGARRRRSADRGFALSDHVDWSELETAVNETGAERVFVTHGYTSIYSRWLNERGIEAAEVKTEFEGELAEISPSEEETKDEKSLSE